MNRPADVIDFVSYRKKRLAEERDWLEVMLEEIIDRQRHVKDDADGTD